MTVAISAVGFQGTISESQEARRWWLAANPVSKQSAGQWEVSPGSGRQVRVSSGLVNVCGVAVYSNSGETVAIPSSSSARTHVVVLRLTWAGRRSRAELVLLSGANASVQLTQNPGVVFEAPLAVVEVPGGFSTIRTSDITGVVPTGGMGGPLQVTSDKHVSLVAAHEGAIIEARGSGTRWQRRGGSTVQLAEDGTQWRFFDPVVRYAGGANIQPGVVNLGNGGVRRGRYKVVDGFVIGDIEIRTGVSGSYWGTGDITIAMPPGVGTFNNSFEDRWFDAHVYTTAEAPMDWACQALARAGQNHIKVFAPKSAADCRMWAVRASDPATGARGTGVPFIVNEFTVPQVITVQFQYSI